QPTDPAARPARRRTRTTGGRDPCAKPPHAIAGSRARSSPGRNRATRLRVRCTACAQHRADQPRIRPRARLPGVARIPVLAGDRAVALARRLRDPARATRHRKPVVRLVLPDTRLERGAQAPLDRVVPRPCELADPTHAFLSPAPAGTQTREHART